MSILRRLRGFFGGGDGDDGHDGEAEQPRGVHRPGGAPGGETPEPAEATGPLGPEDELAAMAGPAGAFDAERALVLFETVCARDREARALALVRQLVARHGSAPALATRAAEVTSGRGDDEGALALLAPALEVAAPPLAALLLAGELAERRGDRQEALRRYQQVLARDLDYPRARERVERLREGEGPRGNLAGATLATDGALARGRYRVERELGRGGAGTVFVAQDLALDRRVALKVYHRRGRGERARLQVEARVPAGLEHPGVVRVFELDEELGAIAMELVAGGSVRRELERAAVPLPRALRWATTALEAVAHVHRAGFVHRDIKPSNLLLRADDRVVLTDFGLALRVGETGEGVGVGEGTLQYMPREQREGAPAAPSADVHAFGVTFREVLGRVGGAVAEEWLELAMACQRANPRERPTVEELRRRLA